MELMQDVVLVEENKVKILLFYIYCKYNNIKKNNLNIQYDIGI